MKRSHEAGLVHPLVVTAVVLAVLSVGLGVFSVWAFLSYQDQKNNVDPKIAAAVATAKQDQMVADQKNFDEQEKLPNRQITGPVDLGLVKLSYPKIWSVYVDHSGGSNSYEAYFYPLVVPPLSSGTPYALRVSIINNQYESVLASFNERIKNGNLKASPVNAEGVDGTRLDGAFTGTVNGAMVLYKIRDKTLEVYTQSQNFMGDFNNTVLKTLEFNK
jgi:hypothetical protein